VLQLSRVSPGEELVGLLLGEIGPDTDAVAADELGQIVR